MKKIVRLTERDLTRLVKRVMNESVVFEELRGFFARCGSQPPTSTSNRIADEIYDSIDYQSPTSTLGKIQQVASWGASGYGTDEKKLIGAFKKMKTFDEFCSTKNSYSRIYHSDMLNDIDDDVDEDEIWKQLSRTVRSLFELRMSRTKPVSSVGGGGQRVMNEDKDNKKMDLKSDFNDIINHKHYSEIEPSDLVEVLEELLHYAKNDVFRSKKPNKGYITKDEVKKNFKKN